MVAPVYGYGIVAKAALDYGGPQSVAVLVRVFYIILLYRSVLAAVL